MKILYIGCVESSEIILKELIKIEKNIIAIITKKESAFNSDFKDLSIQAKENNIPYFFVKNINDDESVKYIKEKQPDIIFCFGWSQLIGTEILKIPALGVIGFHPAKLPFNKGRHPLIWAMALGLKETASSFFYMNENADAGDILLQDTVPIFYEDYAYDLYKRILECTKKQIITLCKKLENNEKKYIENYGGNVWRKRGIKDGEVDWRMSSFAIYNLVRALSKPYIGAHFQYNDKLYKVWKTKEVFEEGYENIEPGKVIKVYDDMTFLIKTYDNLIYVQEYEKFDIKEGMYL